MQIRLRWLWVFLVGALMVGLVSATAMTPVALAAEKSIVWEEFNADITVNADGTFDVAEEQAIRFYDGTFSFGYRNIPKANLGEITDWSIVDASGNTYRQAPGGKEPYTFVVQDTGDEYKVNWYFPPRSDPETYTLYYRVHDGLRYYPDGDQVWWKAVYGDRSFPVQSSQVRVVLPPGAQVDNYVAYINGDEATGRVTGQILDDGRTAIFQTQNWLEAGEELEVRVQFPHGIVAGAAPFWQQAADTRAAQEAADRAQRDRLAPWFDLGFGTLGIVLVVVGPLLVYLLWYNYGRDKPVRQVADYLPEPPDTLQPGLAGILLDDSADMQDVLATLVDLARRKVISITEDTKEGGFWSSNTDFIYRRENRDVPLAAFEQKLLSDVFGSSKEKRLSDLKNKFYSKLPGIKEAMYTDIIGLGFYRSNPERIRTTFGVLGSIAIVLAILFACVLFTVAGPMTAAAICPGLGLFVTAVALLIAARYMPRKTARGSEEAARWRAFKEYLRNIDKYSNLEEQKTIWDRYLPFAIAFGIDKDYIRKFQGVDAPAPGWYIPSPDLYGPYHRRYYGPGPVILPGGIGGGSAGEGGGSIGGSLSDASRGMGANLAGMSVGLGSMLSNAGSTFTSRPSSSGSSGGGGWGGGGWSGGGGFGGGGGGGGGGGFG